MNVDGKETGPQPGDDVTEVAEATTEALDAVHRILVPLRRDVRLNDDERKAFDHDLARIEDITNWADPHGKRNRRPV
jgi:hypothetical protein